jgi:hypothetical protein
MDISHIQQELQNHYREVAPQIWEDAIKQIWLQVGKESITLHQAFFTGKGAVAYERDLDFAEFGLNYYDDDPITEMKYPDDEDAPLPEFNFFEPEPEFVLKTWLGPVEWKDVSAINDTWASTVNDYLKDQADNRLSGVADTTWDGIKNTIADGLANGDSHIDIGKAVEDQLGETWAGRGETIARTETAAASNYASLVTAQASASDLNKIWICSFVNSRDAHMDADSDYGSGSGIPQDEPFEVDGEDLDYPGDPSGSAENVINCMCSIGYEPASTEETSPTTEESGEGAQAAEGDEGVSALTGLTDDQTSQLSGLFDQLAEGTGPLTDEQQSFLSSQMDNILKPEAEAPTAIEETAAAIANDPSTGVIGGGLDDYKSALEAFDKFYDQLDPDNQNLISLFTQEGYEDINGLIREDGEYLEEMSEGMRDLVVEQTRDMRMIIDQAPKYTGTVYRGIGSSSLGRMTAFAGLEPGDIVPFNGLTSTSISEDIADAFSQRSTYQIFMEIQNATGAPIADVSEMPGEQEVVIPHQMTGTVVEKEIQRTTVTGTPTRVYLTIRMNS